jgi:hypothetical protein
MDVPFKSSAYFEDVLQKLYPEIAKGNSEE